MLWPEPNRFTRADIIAGLAHIKPAYSFRSGYAYDNLLYVVAGEVAAAAGGAPYEELVRREVFEPLGLSRCRVGAFDRDAVGNVAQPHMRKDGRNVVTNADDAQRSGDHLGRRRRHPLQPRRHAALGAQLAGAGRAAAGVAVAGAAPRDVDGRARRCRSRRGAAPGTTPMSTPTATASAWPMSTAQWTVSHTGTLSGMYSAMALLPDNAVRLRGPDQRRRRRRAHGAERSAGQALHRAGAGRAPWPTTPTNSRANAAAPVASRAPDTSARGPATAGGTAPWLGRLARSVVRRGRRLCARDDAVRFACGEIADAARAGRARRRALAGRLGRRWPGRRAWLDFAGSGDASTMTHGQGRSRRRFQLRLRRPGLHGRVGDCESRRRSARRRADDTPSPDTGRSLVDIATLVPDIALDIRYAGSDNFVGAPIDGYDAPNAICCDAGGAGAAARRGKRCARTDLRLQAVRLLPAGARGAAFRALGRRPRRPAHQGRATTRTSTSARCSATTSPRSPATAAARPST